MINKTFIATFALLLVAFQLQGMHRERLFNGVDEVIITPYNESVKTLIDYVKNTLAQEKQNKIKNIINKSKRKSFTLKEFKKSVKTKNSFLNFLFDIRDERKKLIAFYPAQNFLDYLNEIFFIPGKSRYIDKDCYFPYDNELDTDEIYETNDENLTYDFYSKTQKRIWDTMRICFSSAVVLYGGQKLINFFFKQS